MLKLRKLATALVLGLIMCLALFGTGAFAQGVGGSGSTIVATHSTAIAGEDSFFGPDAFASSSVFVRSCFDFFGGW